MARTSEPTVPVSVFERTVASYEAQIERLHATIDRLTTVQPVVFPVTSGPLHVSEAEEDFAYAERSGQYTAEELEALRAEVQAEEDFNRPTGAGFD